MKTTLTSNVFVSNRDNNYFNIYPGYYIVNQYSMFVLCRERSNFNVSYSKIIKLNSFSQERCVLIV